MSNELATEPPEACPSCGKAPDVSIDGPYARQWVAYCKPCHFPVNEREPDWESGSNGGEYYAATGPTREAAVAGWNDEVELYLEREGRAS